MTLHKCYIPLGLSFPTYDMWNQIVSEALTRLTACNSVFSQSYYNRSLKRAKLDQKNRFFLIVIFLIKEQYIFTIEI